MKALYRIFQFPGYQVLDAQLWKERGFIEVRLSRDEDKSCICHRCGESIRQIRGKHGVTLRGLPIGTMKVFIHLWRLKGDCFKCKKVRSETIDFISDVLSGLDRQG